MKPWKKMIEEIYYQLKRQERNDKVWRIFTKLFHEGQACTVCYPDLCEHKIVTPQGGQ